MFPTIVLSRVRPLLGFNCEYYLPLHQNWSETGCIHLLILFKTVRGIQYPSLSCRIDPVTRFVTNSSLPRRDGVPVFGYPSIVPYIPPPQLNETKSDCQIVADAFPMVNLPMDNSTACCTDPKIRCDDSGKVTKMCVTFLIIRNFLKCYCWWTDVLPSITSPVSLFQNLPLNTEIARDLRWLRRLEVLWVCLLPIREWEWI
jgi:hypothetical protein